MTEVIPASAGRTCGDDGRPSAAGFLERLGRIGLFLAAAAAAPSAALGQATIWIDPEVSYGMPGTQVSITVMAEFSQPMAGSISPWPSTRRCLSSTMRSMAISISTPGVEHSLFIADGLGPDGASYEMVGARTSTLTSGTFSLVTIVFTAVGEGRSDLILRDSHYPQYTGPAYADYYTDHIFETIRNGCS